MFELRDAPLIDLHPSTTSQGLQTGWISMMSLQSALLGFAIFRLPSLPPPLLRFLSFIPFISRLFTPNRPFTPQENVVLQTTAVATGTLPLAAGLVGIIPALEQLDFKLDGMEPIKLGYWKLVGWSLGICFFGVFLAAPLRKQVIVKEKLVFPSGTATAQLIALLHRVPPPKVPVPTATFNAVSSGQPSAEYSAIPRESRSQSLERGAVSGGGAAGGGGEEDQDGRVKGVFGEEDEEDLDEERQEMGTSGWYILGWSFAASAGLTVSVLRLSYPCFRGAVQ